MVVRVDHGAPQTGRDLVELVAERRHLLGAVFVPRQHLVNGVDDDGRIPPAMGAPDQFRGEPVHGDRMPAKVPDVDRRNGLRQPAEGGIDVPEPVDAGWPVQLQIDVQDRPLPAAPPQPLPTLRDGDGQLDQGERFARLGRADEARLVAGSQQAGNQLRGQRRRVGKHLGQGLRIRQVVPQVGDVGLPRLPVGLAATAADQVLGPIPAPNPRQPGEAGGVAVLPVHLQAGAARHLIEPVHPVAIFLHGRGVHAHQGMQALFAAVHDAGARHLEFPQDGQLLAEVVLVRLDQGVSVRGDVGILAAVAVQRVDPHPGAAFRRGVSNHLPAVLPRLAQLLDELLASPVPCPLLGEPADAPFGVRFLPTVHHNPDLLLRQEHGL